MARSIELTYETVRPWAVRFGLGIGRRIRSTALAWRIKWCIEKVMVTINGKKHWLWRAVEHVAVLDILLQRQRKRELACSQAPHA